MSTHMTLHLSFVQHSASMHEEHLFMWYTTGRVYALPYVRARMYAQAFA